MWTKYCYSSGRRGHGSAELKTSQKWPTPKNRHDLTNRNNLVAIVTRLWVRRSGVEPLQGEDISPIQWAPVVLSSGVERPGPEADHSSPPTASINKHTFIPHHMHSWCAEGNFALTFYVELCARYRRSTTDVLKIQKSQEQVQVCCNTTVSTGLRKILRNATDITDYCKEAESTPGPHYGIFHNKEPHFNHKKYHDINNRS
jgi:hypothetical protein